MALLAAGEPEPPADADRWIALLRGLTYGFDRDEPWCLVVEDLAKPAFLQPPVPEGTWDVLKEREITADVLDMLVTSKNHDLKAGRIARSRPEHWLFSLITLQTCEGFLGRGNYGISRMNGGFASRPFIGASPARGGWGAHVTRDIRMLVTHRRELLENNVLHSPTGGIGLVWLEPWDGEASLETKRLDPYYVEICRRIRLCRDAGTIVAHRGSSSATRINQPKTKHQNKEHTLPTGDPWTPVEQVSAKPLTVDETGFTYKRVVNLLDPAKFSGAPLQMLFGEEGGAQAPMEMVFTATVRGQGETQGFHERRVLVPARAKPFFMRGTASSPRLPQLGRQRVQDVSMVTAKALRPALFALFQGAPDSIDFKDPKAEAKAKIFIAQFERAVDEDFFERLFEELPETEDSDAAKVHRRRWLFSLETRAREALAAAAAGSPLSSVRRYRARAGAESLLTGSIRNTFPDLLKSEVAA